MASCFDFRMRTSSFDLHQLAQRQKMAKFSKLFRSRSEGSVRLDSPRSSPKNSPKVSPKGSPVATTRRRFVRVVKDREAEGEEYDNPHIIRRYTQEYLQDQWAKRASDSLEEVNLPYVVSGHTILKKHASGDRTESPTGGGGGGGGGGGDQSPQQKHASFKDEVQVIEFDKKGKIKTCSVCTHVTRLQDSDEEDGSSHVCDLCLQRHADSCHHLSSDSESSDVEAARDVGVGRRAVGSDADADGEPSRTGSDSVFEKKAASAQDSIVEKLVSVHIELQESERLRGVPTLVSADI